MSVREEGDRATKRPYIDINLPRKLEPYLEEALQNPHIQRELEYNRYTKTPSGLGAWIITQFLIDKTSYRFSHINTFDNRVTIRDRKLNREVDINLKPLSGSGFEMICEVHESSNCEHVKYVRNLPDVLEELKQKGWKTR